MSQTEPLQQRILNMVQEELPVEERPFLKWAQAAGLDENRFLSELNHLIEEELLRPITTVFNSRALGYKSILIACQVEPAYMGEISRIISAHPGVGHNYARENLFNLWFTLTIKESDDFNEAVSPLLNQAGVIQYLILPAVKTYKIGVRFNIKQAGSYGQFNFSGVANSPAPTVHHKNMNNHASVTLNKKERRVVNALQEPVPLIEKPWDTLGKEIALRGSEVIDIIHGLKKKRVVRRISGMVHHQRVGIKGNGLVCFLIPNLQIDEAGKLAADYPQVTHCYQRPGFPEWPYNLYCMIHAENRKKCETIIRDLAVTLETAQYEILFSTKEFKKERIKFSV